MGFSRNWTYLSCSFGLLKRNECLIIVNRMTRQVAAVQAPERIMLNLWKVYSPINLSDASRMLQLAFSTTPQLLQVRRTNQPRGAWALDKSCCHCCYREIGPCCKTFEGIPNYWLGTKVVINELNKVVSSQRRSRRRENLMKSYGQNHTLISLKYNYNLTQRSHVGVGLSP